MVDEPVALRRKYRAENGLVAVSSTLVYKVKFHPQKIKLAFHLRDATRKEERGKFIALASVSWGKCIADRGRSEMRIVRTRIFI